MAAVSPKICDLCCHESTCWAVGECDHPTCIRCTAKLRTLCDQRDCSVCRLKLDRVFVCREVKPFSQLSRSRSGFLGDRKHGILFENHKLYQVYEALRQNSCDKCAPEEEKMFRTFKQLRDHMNRFHDLHYCEICVDNLKLFPREFRSYTRSMLTKHRRLGDTDDTSYKGHPLCKFCDNRYLDNDVLHTHLRTDHLWCHICESNGRQDYYKSYPMLRKHFKEEHFLCEEGSCREEKLTSVFRSQIDIQAHRASIHIHGLSKAEVKQMKQLELGFSYGSGGDVGRGRGAPYFNQRSGRTAQRREQEELEVATALSAPTQRAEKPTKPSPSLPRKSPDEETKPPPGFSRSRVVPTPQPEVIRKSQQTFETTAFNPYSDTAESVSKSKPELTKPPGFENITVLTKPEKKRNDWPEIAAGGEIAKQEDTRLVAQSELTGLHNFGAWARSEKPEQKQPKKNCKPKKEKIVPAYTAESFPSLSEPREKMDGDKIPLSRKQVETKIVEKIRAVLDKTKFTQFKTLSGWYRNDQISAIEYMNQCSNLFGPKWEEIGPNVAAVFPEEEKQIELSRYFSRPSLSAPVRKGKSKKKAKVSTTSVWSSGGRPLTQGVLSDSDYPSLETASTVQGSKVITGTAAWNMVVRST